MPLPRQIKPNVFYVGAIDWDRRSFDELIPLPDGTSYNAYLVKGREKTALIDTVDPTMTDVLVENLERLKTDYLDYIIANHAEQDHSGSLKVILDKYPEAKVVATPKCKNLLMEMLLISDSRILTVGDREILSLGDRTLEFIHAPWVHWPDTMLSYLKEEKLLFTCDFLGSHLATSNLLKIDETIVYEAAKRYYAEIMMPFRTSVRQNLEKIKDLEIEMVAPSHGPLHKDPDLIINAYREWASEGVKNQVVIPYISMHGSTKKMVDYLVAALMERDIEVLQFNLAVVDVGKLAMALVDAATVVIGTPTVLAGPHPNVVYAVYLTSVLRPKLKFASIIGSYGWGGRTVERIGDMISNLNVDLIEPVVIKGYPKGEDFEALDRLADVILNKHREIKIA
jgi:flavorubredoxin